MGESDSLSPLLAELAETVDRTVPPGANHVRQGPLWAVRFDTPVAPGLAVYGPMLCVVAQGAKSLHVGDERYTYGPGRYFLNSVTVPAAGGVLEASRARPCLWLMIELAPALVAEVVRDSGLPLSEPEAPQRAMETPPMDPDLLSALVRLARLFDSPGDAEYLRPLLLREILYRLLRSGQGSRLRQIAATGSEADGILDAVEWLRHHYREPVTVEQLARRCGLSPSALHRQFKRVTAMTPVQFQRLMRLQEANRLMVTEGLDAASAGTRVGYDDPSYFSREYKRFFGAPPRRHVAHLQEEITMANLAYR
jgi:AraC-like DNA-binding protein